MIAALVVILIGALIFFNNRSSRQEQAFVVTQTAEAALAGATVEAIVSEVAR